jgi:hypothetical protein
MEPLLPLLLGIDIDKRLTEEPNHRTLAPFIINYYYYYYLLLLLFIIIIIIYYYS